MENIFKDRRSVNYFDKTKELSEEALKEIINTAVLAPSAFNLQPWEIIAVKSEEAKKKLQKLSKDQPKIIEAPVTLVIVGDREAWNADNKMWDELEKIMGDQIQSRKDAAVDLYGSTEERKIKFAESHGGLLAMSIMYAAKYHGVDSHPMSAIDFEGIKKEFNLKESQEVVMTIALGYFDKSKELRSEGYRRGYDEIVKLV